MIADITGGALWQRYIHEATSNHDPAAMRVQGAPREQDEVAQLRQGAPYPVLIIFT